MATAIYCDGPNATLQVLSDDTNKDLTLTPQGTGDVVSTSDLDCAGGYRQGVDGWYLDNVPVNTSATAMARAGDENYAGMDGKFIALRAGSVTAIGIKSNEACSAGSATAEVTKNGTGIGLSATLDGTNTTSKITTQAKDADAFVAGDELGVTIVTSADWAPTSADVRVAIEIET